jgi:hypothetical protein
LIFKYLDKFPKLFPFFTYEDFEKKPKIIETIDFDEIYASMVKNESTIKGNKIVYHS